MKNLILFSFIGLSACNSEKITPLSESIAANFAWDATFFDVGCGKRIIVQDAMGISTTYIASEATVAVLDEFTKQLDFKQNALGYTESINVPINITFKKTGKMGKLFCGRGGGQSVKTIDIQEINIQAVCGND